MITCNIMGGLGNQLFQIFATISYAIENKQIFTFLLKDVDKVITLDKDATQVVGKNVGPIVRPTYWDNIFKPLQIFLRKQLPRVEYKIKEAGFDYDELPLLKDLFYKTTNTTASDLILLHGYFQSYKYFEKYQNNIFKLLRLEKQKEDAHKYMPTFDKLAPLISMHFRFGDYKSLQHIYVLATYNYYKNSIEYIQNTLQNDQLNILYFCEENDLEEVTQIIDQLKSIDCFIQFIRAPSNIPDYTQMLMMSLCDHNIIPNSTFSWWGAYLNASENKIVCYPSKWFVRSANISECVKDLCPPSWTKIGDE